MKNFLTRIKAVYEQKDQLQLKGEDAQTAAKDIRWFCKKRCQPDR